ncbi:hypothetical protein GW916_05940 [bacterium]|nr:hypothetical protein [bacterium]
MKFLIQVALLSSMTLTFAACSKNQSTDLNSEDVILKSYMLIDSQRTDEAIDVLEIELSKNPGNQKVRSALASAYAHKGGIRVQKLVSAVAKVEALSDLSEAVLGRDEGISLSENIDKIALSTAKIFSHFSNVFALYESIPTVTKDESIYVSHAISLLDEIGDSIPQEDALYRAILSIVLFKHLFSENLIGEVLKTKFEAGGCQLNIGEINDSIIKLGKLLLSILRDLKISNPSQAGDLEKVSDEISSTTSNLTLATSSLIVIDSAASVFLQQNFIENGLGKLIRCGGD